MQLSLKIFMVFSMLAWTFGPITPQFAPRAAHAAFTGVQAVTGALVSGSQSNQGAVIIEFAGAGTLPNTSAQCWDNANMEDVDCYINDPGFFGLMNTQTSDEYFWDYITRYDKITSNGADTNKLFITWMGQQEALTTAPDSDYAVAMGFSEWGVLSDLFTAALGGMGFAVGCSGDCVPQFDQSSGGMTQGDTFVIFSGPPEGGMGVPIDETIRVGFSNPLDETTVTSANVRLETDAGAAVAGELGYCENRSDPSSGSGSIVCDDVLFDMDFNTIIFNPNDNLTADACYKMKIESGVRDISGEMIQGNFGMGQHEVFFCTSAGDLSQSQDFDTYYGQEDSGGAWHPAYVEDVAPFAGPPVPANVSWTVRFNKAMDMDTLSDYIALVRLTDSGETAITTTKTPDMATRESIGVQPASDLAEGEYELRVLGGTSTTDGIPMFGAGQEESIAWSSVYYSSGVQDSTKPTLYCDIADGQTGIPVNKVFECGASEPLDMTTVNSTNITMSKGASSVSLDVSFDPGSNSVFIVPGSALVAGADDYTLSFSDGGIKDLSGIGMDAASFSFETGAADSATPKVRHAFCSDFDCRIEFNEPMAHASSGSNYSRSAINPENLTLSVNGGQDQITSSARISYENMHNEVIVEGLDLVASIGQSYLLTVSTNVKDLTGNAIDDADNDWNGVIEDSFAFFDDFGAMGGEFQSDGFGGFGAMGMFFGGGVSCYPFNPMASASSDVFQCNLKVAELGDGVTVQDGDVIKLAFPNGTGVTNAAQDTWSPFVNDFASGAADVKYAFDPVDDATYGTNGIASDADANTVSIQVDVSERVTGGTPRNGDFLTIDLRGITNPAIPKGPDTQGYSVTVKLERSGVEQASVISTPYFIEEAGSNTINIKMYAGSSTSPTDASGDVFGCLDGPGGACHNFTLASGALDQVDGTSVSSNTYAFTGMPDGCYFFRTDPYVIMGSDEFFGKDFPEPICVSGAQAQTKTIVLESATGGQANSVNLNVEINKPGGFSPAADIDVFAGCGGGFTSRTLDDQTSATISTTLRLPNRAGGGTDFCFVGIGPAMPKGSSGGMPDFDAFGAMPPEPVDLKVNYDQGTIGEGFFTPSTVTVDPATTTVTFDIVAANIEVPVEVKDGSGNGLGNVDVFMHSRGMGGGAFKMTDALGAATLKVANLGSYEIGAHKPGLGETFRQLDIRGTQQSPEFYIDGAPVSTVTLNMYKPDYTISGKLLDASGDPIPYAPIFAEAWNPPATEGGELTQRAGQFVHGHTENDGSYTVFVSGSAESPLHWRLKGELPPEESNTCGTFIKDVRIAGESKSNQNITPGADTTCYTVTGTVTINGELRGQTYVFAEEWLYDAESGIDMPSGGFFRGAPTDSDGAYTLKLTAGTYRIGTFHTDFGEVADVVEITQDTTNNINSGTLEDITFSFTGGDANMDGFIEVKKSNDRHTRFGKPLNGTDESVTVSVKSGTYQYFVDIFGVGQYEGTVATGGTVTIDVSDTTLVTLSGTVKDSAGAALPNVVVALENTDTEVRKFAKTDSDGTYSLTVDSGTYNISGDRAGYVGPQAASISVSEDTTDYDFGGDSPDQASFEAADNIISGTVEKAVSQYGADVPMDDGFVVLTNSSTSQRVSAPIDPSDGTFSVPVTDGTWTVAGKGPMHANTEASGAITVADGQSESLASDLVLSYDATKEPKSSSKSFSAQSGGTFDDTDDTDMKLVASGGVLANSGTVNVAFEKNFDAPETDMFTPLNDQSFGFQVTDSNNTQKTDFSGNVDLMFEYDPSLLPEGVDENELTVGYYDTDADTYRECEGGVTIDAVNNIATCRVDHATEFAIVYSPSEVLEGGTGRSADITAPGVPSSLSATLHNGQPQISWVDPADSDLKQIDILRGVGGVPASGTAFANIAPGTQTFLDTGAAAGNTYSYRVRSVDTSNNMSSASYEVSVTATSSSQPDSGSPGGGSPGGGSYTPPADDGDEETDAADEEEEEEEEKEEAAPAKDARTLEIEAIKAEAGVVKAGIAKIREAVSAVVDAVKESAALELIERIAGTVTDALKGFIAYGTDTTQVLGEGERAGVVNSFKAAFDKEPATDTDWEDVIKIANGRWPSQLSAAAEAGAKERFEDIYLREPDMDNPNDNAAVTIMAYGLRPDPRNLDSEKAAIKIFEGIFGHAPTSANDWDAVRAIGYSGATR